MNKSNFMRVIFFCICSIIFHSANSALLPRLPDGAGGYLAYYDDVLNITLLTDANAAAGSIYDDGNLTTDGRLSYLSAEAWISNLNISGFASWRLPNMDRDADTVVVDCSVVSELVCRDNELAYMYYYNNITRATPSPFTNILFGYWSSNADPTNPPDAAWIFVFGGIDEAKQALVIKAGGVFVWAVADGDVFPPALIGVAPTTYKGANFQAYYNDEAGLTWLTNANTPGLINWADAQTWAAGLDVSGVTGWRLPDTLQPDSSCSTQGGGDSYGLNCTGSEFGNMFYNVLGGVAGQSITTTHNSNYYLFSDVQTTNNYWSATVYDPIPTDAWVFYFATGTQLRNTQTNSYYAWAVHDGDIRALIDYDGDGLPDVVEDSNDNGIVDTGETDPLNPDSDNDGALDGQEDSNANGIVDAGETNPLDFDSDDDGLTDGYEINVSMTDPTASTTLFPGDMNRDGVVNVGDLLLLQRQLLGYPVP